MRFPYRTPLWPVQVICTPLVYTFARVPGTRARARLPCTQTPPMVAKSTYYLHTPTHPLKARPSQNKKLIFDTTTLLIMHPSLRLPFFRAARLRSLCLNSTSIYLLCPSLRFLYLRGLKRIQSEGNSCRWIALT